MTRTRVLRALSRFDVATVGDLSHALGMPNPSQQKAVWRALQLLVTAGHATRDGERGHVARYSVTEAGRLAAKEAA